MMKKAMLALLALALLAAPLFANGTTETTAKPADSTVTLTFVETMTSPSRTAQIEKIIADYEATHPTIKVKLVSPPYEQADNKLTMMLNNNEELDVVEVRDHTVKQFVNNKKLIDLTSYLDKWSGTSDLLPLTVQAARTVDNTPYFLPQFFFIKGLFVRTDILDKYGMKIPTTVDELYEEAIAITGKAPNQYGYGFRGKSNPHKISDILTLASVPNVSTENVYVTTDGKSVFTTPEGRKGLADYQRLFQKAVPADGLNWGFSEQVNAFIAGTTPFLVQDPDTISMIAEALDPSQYTVVAMPLGNNGTAYLDYGYAGLGIPVTSKHPAEAWDFISYVVSAEVNAEFCKGYGPLPVHKSTFDNDAYFSSGVYKSWATEMSEPDKYIFVKYPLDSPKYPAWPQYEEQTMQAMLLGKTTPDQLAEQWEAYWK